MKSIKWARYGQIGAHILTAAASVLHEHIIVCAQAVPTRVMRSDTARVYRLLNSAVAVWVHSNMGLTLT